ncbi:MAG: SCO family protein [Candidatus Brocadiia bacterium]|nr:SCO family protein [Candidatus Brocadiia bacterium]
MGKKLWVLVALLVACGIVGLAFMLTRNQPPASPEEKATGFELTDQDGRTISLDSLEGKVKVLSFFYIGCVHPNMCPLGTRKLVDLQQMVGAGNDNVVFLRVTFDPENDDAEALKKYGELYGVDFSNWHFLRGDVDNVSNLCREYKITLERQDDGTIKHSMLLYLVDQSNYIDKVYTGSFWEPQGISEDITALLE